MRKDYEYVDNATAIDLVCTKKGDAYIDQFCPNDPNVDIEEVIAENPIIDLLMYLQDQYVSLDGTDDILSGVCTYI